MDTQQKQPRRRGVSLAATGLIIVALAVLAIGGYYLARQITGPSAKPIGDILDDLRTYNGQVVTVKGEVTNRVSVLGFKYYDVQDETGSIAVLTQRGLPAQGETVTVTGIVDEMFAIGPMTMVVIKEPADV